MSLRIGLTDHPIERAEQDLFGRSRYADLLATEIRTLDASHGAVVGVLGPWGFGKTSLLNMVVERLRDDPRFPVVEFNPWLFVRAIDAALAVLETEASRARRGRDGLLQVDADGFVAARSVTGRLAPAIPNSTPTCWSPTWPTSRGTIGGRLWTRARSTPGRRPPATSTRRSSAPS
jgi:KAP family P-loop domain